MNSQLPYIGLLGIKGLFSLRLNKYLYNIYHIIFVITNNVIHSVERDSNLSLCNIISKKLQLLIMTENYEQVLVCKVYER